MMDAPSIRTIDHDGWTIDHDGRTIDHDGWMIQGPSHTLADAMGLGSVMAAPNLPKEGVHDLPGDPDKAAANEAAGGKEQEPSNQEMKKGGKGRGRGGKGKKKD